MLNETQQAALTKLCRDLIRIPSNSGHEEAVAAYLREYLLGVGFDSAETDENGNLVACVRGDRPGCRLLFDGHIDTVPVEDPKEWKHPPYAAEVEDGKIYGRGATDMKGSVAAFCFAAGEFLKTHGRGFAGELFIAGIVHEECFEGISARAVSQAVKPDLVVIGEASEMNLKCSQRGRAELVLETFGVPCHSSNPQKGVNAVYSMCRAVDEIRRLPPVKNPAMAADGILELTDIKSAPYPGASVVPEYCRATFDRRLLVGETRESVLEPIREILDRLHSEDPKFRAEISYSCGEERCYTGKTIAAERFFPAWLEDPASLWLQAIMENICAKGYRPKLSGYRFCTNGSHYAGEAGIPCIGIGPSCEELAHTVDEFVELNELFAVADYDTAVMETILRENDYFKKDLQTAL